jgi:hypothetical protein
LEIDDCFGAHQAARQTAILPLQECHFGCQRIRFGGLWAALGRHQRANSPGIPEPAPVGQCRGVDALAAQDGAHPAFFGGPIGLGQDAQLVLGGERPAARPIR